MYATSSGSGYCFGTWMEGIGIYTTHWKERIYCQLDHYAWCYDSERLLNAILYLYCPSPFVQPVNHTPPPPSSSNFMLSLVINIIRHHAFKCHFPSTHSYLHNARPKDRNFPNRCTFPIGEIHCTSFLVDDVGLKAEYKTRLSISII